MIPGPSELLIIFGVALLLFGPSKLPQLGSAIGESIRNFRKGMKPHEGGDNPEPQGSQSLLAPPPTTVQAQTPSQQQLANPTQAVTVVSTESKDVQS